MKTITFNDARLNLTAALDSVCKNLEPVTIVRNQNQSVVLLSLEEYESIKETEYLFCNPTNAKRLLSTIESLDEIHITKSKQA